MSNRLIVGSLVAVIGEWESLRAALSALPGKRTVFSESIPFYPGLSVRDNVRQLRMMLPDGSLERFEALLSRSGLKKEGWTHPFRKDMVGQKRLFGLLEAMLTEPEGLLVCDLLAGMEAKQREAFAGMAALYQSGGGSLIYTSPGLKDVLRLELPQEVWLPGSGGFMKTDAAALRARLGAAETPEEADALMHRMEAGELW